MQFQGRDEQATGVADGVGGRVTCSWGGGLLLMGGFCGVQATLGNQGGGGGVRPGGWQGLLKPQGSKGGHIWQEIGQEVAFHLQGFL